MKTDMHYFGVYALARAAGMREKPADKLLWRKNSRIAKTMVRRNTAVASEAPCGLHLMGITAHVYKDS